jgi:hypothetical protein
MTLRDSPMKGDTLFEQEYNLQFEKREHFDMKGEVQQKIFSCIEKLLHDDVGKEMEEDA